LRSLMLKTAIGCVQRAVSLKRAWRCSINLTVHYDDGHQRRRSKKELDARVRVLATHAAWFFSVCTTWFRSGF
jgi:hypothetical protein